MIAHEILHVVSSQDNRSPTATRLTERKRNGDDRTCFTISGFLRSDWPMLSTKRRPVHQRQLSQAPLMCVIQPAQLSLTNLWTAVTLVHAIVPSPQRKRTQECCRRRCGEGDIVVALRSHHQRARASSSGCCPSSGDKQRGCRSAGHCRISTTRCDATP